MTVGTSHEPTELDVLLDVDVDSVDDEPEDEVDFFVPYCDVPEPDSAALEVLALAEVDVDGEVVEGVVVVSVEAADTVPAPDSDEAVVAVGVAVVVVSLLVEVELDEETDAEPEAEVTVGEVVVGVAVVALGVAVVVFGVAVVVVGVVVVDVDPASADEPVADVLVVVAAIAWPLYCGPPCRATSTAIRSRSAEVGRMFDRKGLAIRCGEWSVCQLGGEGPQED